MIIALIVIVVLVVIVAGMYNSLVQARNKVKNAWSQIDVQLQRRFDLVPNLVESVKGYMNHEEATLTKVAELRGAWGNAKTVGEKANLDNELSRALTSIMAVAESYPDLKASQNFLQLQEELKNTESKVSYSRQFYNDTVTMYNNKLEVIPTNIIAGLFNFKPEELFKVESEEARKSVKVDFNN